MFLFFAATSLGLFLLAVAARYSQSYRKSNSPSEVGSEFGAIFRVPRGMFAIITAMVFLAVIIFATLLVSRISIVMEQGWDVRGVLAVIGSGVAALACLIALSFMPRGFGNGMLLAISPKGVEYVNLSKRRFAAWNEISGISPFSMGDSKFIKIETLKTESFSGVGKFSGRSRKRLVLDIPAHAHNIEPELLLALVRFYFDNPDHRVELTSTVAERLASRNFTP